MGTQLRSITVLIVDDHPLIRRGITAMLASEPDIRVIGEAVGKVSAVDQYHLLRPDVTLMDLQMNDGDGIDAILDIRRADPAASIIVLTTYAGDVRAQRALSAVAQAYLLKGSSRDLAHTIRAVADGFQFIDGDVNRQISEHLGEDSLSDREIQVLKLVSHGNANKEIGRLLSIAEGTVKSHLKSIMSKLAASDRTHAVMVGMQRGVI